MGGQYSLYIISVNIVVTKSVWIQDEFSLSGELVWHPGETSFNRISDVDVEVLRIGQGQYS